MIPKHDGSCIQTIATTANLDFLRARYIKSIHSEISQSQIPVEYDSRINSINFSSQTLILVYKLVKTLFYHLQW